MRTTVDMPVAVDLDGALAAEVTAFLEIEANWQVVSTEGPLRPTLLLSGEARPGAVVVTTGPLGAEAVREALLAGAVDVIAWPDDRHRLLDIPQRLPASAAEPGTALLGVGGTAGGVGTSTVTLATGALLAWAGREALVVGGDDLLRLSGHGAWTGPGVGDLARLDPRDAAAEIDGLAVAVAGVPRLRVLGGGAAALGSTQGWPVDVVVADLRGDGPDAASLLVGRPDAALEVARGRSLVVNGRGPLDPSAARRAGARMLGVLPESARVARAGSVGRVPAGLPGSWLADLKAVLRKGVR